MQGTQGIGRTRIRPVAAIGVPVGMAVFCVSAGVCFRCTSACGCPFVPLGVRQRAETHTDLLSQSRHWRRMFGVSTIAERIMSAKFDVL